MSDPGRILVVDDDHELRDTIREYFEVCGFAVYAVADGEGMRKVVAQSPVDVVIMDLNLPGDDGLALTRELRSTSRGIGIVMLTAADQTIDRIVGLEMGADDYVSKPCDMREVLARVKSVLRRIRAQPPEANVVQVNSDMIPMGDCMLDLGAHQLYGKDGAIVPVTAMEFDLLKAFALHPNRVLSRSYLLEQAHHRELDVFERSIDLRIARIRRKIEANSTRPQVLKTVRGAGYIFVSGSRK